MPNRSSASGPLRWTPALVNSEETVCRSSCKTSRSKCFLHFWKGPAEVVTREELRTKLWPADTFIDFDHGLNAAVKRLRDALGLIGFVCLLLVLAIAASRWVLNHPSSLPHERRLHQAKLTNNVGENSVISGAISPDGKYLAYADVQGMHLRLLTRGCFLALCNNVTCLPS